MYIAPDSQQCQLPDGIVDSWPNCDSADVLLFLLWSSFGQMKNGLMKQKLKELKTTGPAWISKWIKNFKYYKSLNTYSVQTHMTD